MTGCGGRCCWRRRTTGTYARAEKPLQCRISSGGPRPPNSCKASFVSPTGTRFLLPIDMRQLTDTCESVSRLTCNDVTQPHPMPARDRKVGRAIHKYDLEMTDDRRHGPNRPVKAGKYATASKRLRENALTKSSANARGRLPSGPPPFGTARCTCPAEASDSVSLPVGCLQLCRPRGRQSWYRWPGLVRSGIMCSTGATGI